VIEYVHPAFMVFTLVLVFQALRHGIVLRRGAQIGLKPAARFRHRVLHLRYAKLAMLCIVVGALGGIATMFFELDRPMLSTFHGMAGFITAATFLAAGRLGRELEAGKNSQRDLHAWTAFVAILGASITLVAGFVLLP
jgi:hypothetical protein